MSSRLRPAPSGGRPSLLAPVAQMGLEVGRVVADRLDRRSPVPRTIAAVDGAYLSRLLGVEVTGVRAVDVTAGTTDRARLLLDSPGAGVPESVFVKIAPTKTVTRIFTNLSNLGRSELGFYRDVSPGLDIETPAAVALDDDPRTKRFAIVIEDLTARGARFTDTVGGVTLPEAETVVDTLARLHGAFWESLRFADPGAGGLAWVTTNSGDPQLPIIQKALVAAGRKVAKDHLEYVPREGVKILARYLAVADELDAGPHTLLHGDPHPGNVYFIDASPSSGDALRGGLFDWQVLRRGNGTRDLTYFLVLGLETDQRRQHGEALLARYRDGLARAGGPTLDPDRQWLDVRKMAAYAYASAVFAAAFAGLQAEPVTTSGLAKSSAALNDLDTGTAIACLG
ncbi:MAG TPA: phosphotransferase [Acidimicrobiales bacterium]|nr:phosphotransferase [Acidimicrobiales bacterium]